MKGRPTVPYGDVTLAYNSPLKHIHVRDPVDVRPPPLYSVDRGKPILAGKRWDQDANLPQETGK